MQIHALLFCPVNLICKAPLIGSGHLIRYLSPGLHLGRSRLSWPLGALLATWHPFDDLNALTALLTRAWQEYFYNATDRGRAIFCPPQNSGTTGQIYKIPTAYDRSGKFVEGNLMLLTPGSLMTSQVRSKSKRLTIWSIWFVDTTSV